MGALILCGFEESWCMFSQDRLAELGVPKIEDQSSSSIGAREFLERIQFANVGSSDEDVELGAITPGRVWELAASSILIENSTSPVWSWADPRHIRLLNFWSEFDPDCKFLFIYDDCAASLSRDLALLVNGDRSLEDAARDWCTFHRTLLQFHHEKADRCLLVHVSHFENLGTDVATLLSEQLGVPERRLNEPKFRNESNLSNLLLRSHMDGSEEFSKIYQYLEEAASLSSGTDQKLNGGVLSRAGDELIELSDRARLVKSLKESNLALSESLQKSLTHSAEQKATINALNDELGSLQVKHANLKDDFDAINQQLGFDQHGLINPKAEVELLQLQLAQSREELELYFKKYLATQEELDLLSGGVELEPAPRIDAPSDEGVPAQSFARTFDLRDYVDGVGWHNAEAVGRWAGAAAKSTLIMPELPKQDYKVRIRIVDTITPAHLSRMKVSFNGQKLNGKLTLLADIGGRLAQLRRLRASMNSANKCVPAEFLAHVPKQLVGGDFQRGTLEIETIPPVSPKELGQSDTRKLSICVELVEVTEASSSAKV